MVGSLLRYANRNATATGKDNVCRQAAYWVEWYTPERLTNLCRS